MFGGGGKACLHHLHINIHIYDLLPTSDFVGFSISCSSMTVTVEQDERRPCDEARPAELASITSSRDKAVELLRLLEPTRDAAVLDLTELTDGMLPSALKE